jgi:hypothetical protein
VTVAIGEEGTLKEHKRNQPQLGLFLRTGDPPEQDKKLPAVQASVDGNKGGGDGGDGQEERNNGKA